VEASKRGRSSETETEGGRVKVNNDGFEVEDDDNVLEVSGSVLWARGWWATCLRLMTACSRLGMSQRCALRPGTR
jgi:hypothetical protein